MKNKVFLLWLFSLLFTLNAFAQMSVDKIESFIPKLQYDDDFMKYTDFAMLDGFNVVKSLVGWMKFDVGKKVYAIELDKFSENKKLKSKTTYFYIQTVPVAISVERKGITQIYYLSDGKVIGYKQFNNKVYKPYGGSKPLDIRQIPLAQKVKTPKAKTLKRASVLLNQVRSTSKQLFDYQF
jgi:hypothetical protein